MRYTASVGRPHEPRFEGQASAGGPAHDGTWCTSTVTPGRLDVGRSTGWRHEGRVRVGRMGSSTRRAALLLVRQLTNAGMAPVVANTLTSRRASAAEEGVVRVIAVSNQKGGVGKTTTVVNLAAAARRAGQRVLTIDANPQAHLSRHVGAEPDAIGLSALLRAAAAMQLDDDMLRAVLDQPRKGGIDCGDLIPAEATLDDDAAVLLNVSGREQLLREALVPIHDDYDVAIIDTAPGFDLIATNAWVAADEVLVPCPPEVYALEGLAKLARHLAEVRHRLNPDLRVLGILLTLAELHTVDGRATADALRAGAPWPVLEQVVAKRVAYRQAASERVSVDALDAHLSYVWDLICEEVLTPTREVLSV
mgnify:CR=1 FL=1